MKRKILFSIMFALLITANTIAQVDINTNTYTFSRSGFAPTALTSPVTLIGANSDNVASAVTDIGFTFWFAGTPYTQFSVNENGLMTLGSTPISGTDIANNMASATTLPKIAPYWDDLATGTNGSVVYTVSGTTPNRILYINWLVTIPKNLGGTANSTIQVQLSETSGNITFTYGTPAIPTNANGYTIGIGKSATDFVSVTTTTTTAATAAYGTSKDNNTLSIGASSRFNFITDRTAPTISTQTIPNSGGTANRTLLKTISDAKTGIPTSGNFVPRIYFKKSTDATYVSTPGVYQSGTSWLFTVDHGMLTNVASGDQINYFVVAQDQATTVGVPNIASYPAGVVATDVNTIVTPPAPSTYIIGASYAGTVTVGVGGNFTSLTSTGGLFEMLNAGQLSGNLIVQIISDLNETGTVALGALVEAPGGPFTITIVPVGQRTINAGANGLRFNGVKRLTMDGLNNGNSLTYTSTAPILFYAGASDNTFTRLTIQNGGISTTDASGSFPVNCSNNTIDNCIIEGGGKGIYFGSWVSTTGRNNKITNNVIKNFGQYGIQLDRGYSDFTISGNDIYQTSGSGYSTGIYATPSTSLGTVNIFNNKIHDLTSGTSLGMSTCGIYYSATGTYNIYNNEISLEATSTNTQADKIYGILVGSAGTSNVYHNSIYIGGTGVTKGNSVGFYRTAGTVTFKNNVVYNARSTTASQYTKNFGVITANLTGFVSDNNLIFADGTSAMLYNIGGQPGFAAGTDYATLELWQTASGQDANSYSANPGFTSPTNLLPDATNPASNLLDGKGTPIALVTSDIRGNARDAATPDIGAYEFTGSSMSYTIVGNAGLPGVTLSYTDGSAKSVQSGADGSYSLTVSYSWSGTVTPSLTGYTFTPENRSFANVVADQTRADFTPVPILYTISGKTGKAFTPLKYEDGSDAATARDDGSYSFTVAYNWSGTVKPLWPGFTYTPESITYENVLSDQPNQDYSVAPTVFTISGNAGVEGTILTYTDGSVKTVIAGTGGAYSITVSYNWSGTVTPALSGYTFQPSSRTYTNLLASLPGQDFSAGASSYLIVGNTGVGEVVLSYTVNNENLTVTSTPIGNYIINVPFQWSGTVTPSKTYYTFDPISYTYSDVAANQMGQNYAATCVNPTDGGTISASILSGCEPFDPSLITGTEVAGPVEYKWQSAVAPFETWTDIESNTADYQPGAITQTTQYKRLVRATCMANWTGAAESNVVTMTVNGLPQLEMTMNAITVTANNDGIEETGSFDVCNSATNSLSLSAMTDLKNVSGTIKVTTEVVTTTNVTSTFSNVTALLSDYAIPTTQSVSLIDPALPGTLALRFQLFNDLNDNNSLDAGECAGDWVVYTISVHPVLTASVTVTASANTVCEGTEVTFTAEPINEGSAPTYEWLVNGIPAGSGSSYSYVPANDDKVSVVMTSNATPCLAQSLATSTEVVMIVNPILTPGVSIESDFNTYCAGDWPLFIATPVNGGVDPVYVWKVNGKIIDYTGSSYSYQAVNGDIVTCEMTPDATVTCPGISPALSNAITMVVNPTGASVSIVSDVNTVCQGTQVNFTATPTNSGDAPIYQWKVDGVEAGDNSPTFSYIPDNGDIVTCEMTSNAPCVAANPVVSNSVEVTVNPILTASVTIAANVNNVCEGTEVTFTPTPVNGGSAPAYQWYVGNDPVGSGSTYTYAPAQGDIVSVVMTSNSTECLASMTATSDPITMTVYTRPMLQATINGATVTNNNDGIDDTQSLNVCNVKSKNLFYEFAEMTGIAPASVKVIEQYTLSNVIVGLINRTFTLSAPLVGSTNVRLSNIALPGSLVMRYRVFIDGNNNNLLDASECAGDWIVYTVTIDPALKAPGAITGSVNFTPNSTRTYSVMPVANATGYIWSYSGKGATITPPNPAGNSVSISFSATATAGTLSVKAVNNCGESPLSSLKLRLTKSGQIAVDPLTASEEVIPLMVYPVRNVEIRVEGTVNSGAMATLYDMLGRVVLTKELEEGNLNILSLQGLKTAVYVLSINDNGNIQTFKVPLRE